MINATEIRKGNIIKMDGELYQVASYQHVTPGNLRGFVQTKLRHLASGNLKDHRFRSSDRVEKAFLDTQEMAYLYSDGEGHHFMNNETYEQICFSSEVLGDSIEYIKPETIITVDFHDGKPVGIELPATVELKVAETTPGMKHATVSNVTKPATLETGLIVQVPPFIDEGEVIRVNTETGEYLGRV
ncbi:MAG: elongation factor P [Acidobacteria bacterium]|nr:elongation factor P [Acidobacteriota bacterium]